MQPDFDPNLLSAPEPSAAWLDASWKALLQLSFAVRGEKTVLVSRQHYGPLSVQRPFYPEGNLCHVYLLHPPGGVVAGDQLGIQIELAPAAQSLLTTPAAGKFYTSTGAEAKQTVKLKVAAQASLEWLPQETIIYEGARLSTDTEVDLHPSGHFIGWEIFALGRPVAGEGFERGQLDLSWRIFCGERLLYRERLVIDAQTFAARWGMNGNSACATLFAYPATPHMLAKVQGLIADQTERGVTLIDNLLICRGIDARADRLRDFFHTVWQLIRADMLQRPACSPRIWAT
jgi:urease accessory protein